jgi:hypothetical protein
MHCLLAFLQAELSSVTDYIVEIKTIRTCQPPALLHSLCTSTTTSMHRTTHRAGKHTNAPATAPASPWPCSTPCAPAGPPGPAPASSHGHAARGQALAAARHSWGRRTRVPEGVDNGRGKGARSESAISMAVTQEHECGKGIRSRSLQTGVVG